MKGEALVTAFALLPFGVAIVGLLFRLIYSRGLDPIRLHHVGPRQALEIVGLFVLAGVDTDFGFPSGFFELNEKRVDADLEKGKLVITEGLLRGHSGFFSMVQALYYWALQAMSRLAAGGESFGCFMAVLVGSLMLAPAPFLIYAGIAEASLRFAFRSNVRITTEVVGEDTDVHIVLRGLSALSLERDLQQAFRPAALPRRFHPALRVPPADVFTAAS